MLALISLFFRHAKLKRLQLHSSLSIEGHVFVSARRKGVAQKTSCCAEFNNAGLACASRSFPVDWMCFVPSTVSVVPQHVPFLLGDCFGYVDAKLPVV